MEAFPVSDRGNTHNLMTFISKSGIPIQLFHKDLSFSIWECGSFDGSFTNKPLGVSIYIRLLVNTNVFYGVEGVRQEVHKNQWFSHCFYSNPDVMGLEVASSKHCPIDSQQKLGWVLQLVIEADGSPSPWLAGFCWFSILINLQLSSDSNEMSDSPRLRVLDIN